MNEERLYTEERRKKILDLIRINGSINVNLLAKQFHVSGTTIRLDLTALESQGEISRTHGGAVLNTLISREPALRERVNDLKKEAIAQKALEFIESGDTLLLDTGTTILSLAKALVKSSINRLTIYTNDLDVMQVLEDKSDYDLHIFGGKIRNGFHYSYGNEVISELQNYNFRKLFLATSAISIRNGLTTSNSDLASVKKTMIASSEEIYLLTDSTKLNHIDFQKFAEISDVQNIIIDRNVSEHTISDLSEFNIRVILA